MSYGNAWGTREWGGSLLIDTDPIVAGAHTAGTLHERLHMVHPVDEHHANTLHRVDHIPHAVRGHRAGTLHARLHQDPTTDHFSGHVAHTLHRRVHLVPAHDEDHATAQHVTAHIVHAVRGHRAGTLHATVHQPMANWPLHRASTKHTRAHIVGARPATHAQSTLHARKHIVTLIHIDRVISDFYLGTAPAPPTALLGTTGPTLLAYLPRYYP